MISIAVDKSNIQPLCTKKLKESKSSSNPADLGASGKNDDKDPSAKVVSDSSKKEGGQRLFGLASTIAEGSFYGMLC